MFKINRCKRGVSLLAATAMIFSFICTAIVINPPLTAFGESSTGSGLPTGWSSAVINTDSVNPAKMDGSTYSVNNTAKSITLDTKGDGKFSSGEVSANYVYTNVGTADFDLQADITVNTQYASASNDYWAALIATTGTDASALIDANSKNNGVVAAMFGPKKPVGGYQYRGFVPKGASGGGGTGGTALAAAGEWTTATMRLQRVGDVYTMSYYDGANWVQIASSTLASTIFTGAAKPAYIGLAVTRTSNITFSNIKLNGENVFGQSGSQEPTTQGFETMNNPTIMLNKISLLIDGTVDVIWLSDIDIESDVNVIAEVVSKPNSSAISSKAAEPLSSNKKTGFAKFSLDASGEYSFRIFMTNGSTVKQSTEESVNYELPLAKPSLTASAGEGCVTLNWNAVKEADGYDIYKDGAKIYSATSAENSYTVAGLTAGTEYSFYVVAKRGVQTNQSDTKTATPVAAGSWMSVSFGSNIGNPTKNTVSVENGTVTMKAAEGKINGNTDGLTFYYRTMDASDTFELKADVDVVSYDSTSSITSNNQKSFGLMIRDAIGANNSTEEQASIMAALGAGADSTTKPYGIMGITRTAAGASLARGSATMLEGKPTAGSKYKMVIRKVGNSITYIVNNTVVGTATVAFTGDIFAGAYVARDCEVKFTNLEIDDKLVLPKSLSVISQPAKTTYYQNEDFDAAGLKIQAVMTDNTTQDVDLSQCTISGFNSAAVGAQTVTVTYNGVSTTFNVNVLTLELASISVASLPYVTEYYIGEPFNAAGLAINKVYNSGLSVPIDSSLYTLSGYDSAAAGTKTITATFAEGGITKTASFNVTVKNSAIKSISVYKSPTRTTYYQGYVEAFDKAGLSVLLTYTDGNSVVLANDAYTTDATVDVSKTGSVFVGIYYKNLKTTCTVNVQKELPAEIKIKKLPVTTIMSGETFSSNGLEVVKLMNSLREIPMTMNTDYTLDTSAIQNTPGVYPVYVKPLMTGNATPLAAAKFYVTVRDKKTYTWNSVIFGQSTSITSGNNIVAPSNPGTAEGTIRVAALNGAGKVTGSHDGISFYYTELDPKADNFKLTAKIKVNSFAKDTPDGQEGFGIMVRDAINKNGNSDTFASNIAFVGGFKGLRPDGVNYQGALQLIVRSGVNDTSGAGAKMSSSNNPIAPRPKSGDVYTMTLEKTNSGFTGKIEGYGEDTVYITDLMDKIDASKMYLGFFAARVADIEVSDVKLTVTDVNSDTPKQPSVADPVVPYIMFSSIPYTTTSKYNLSVYTSCAGYMTISQEGAGNIIENQYVSAGGITVPVNIPAQSTAKFKAVFIPSTEVALTSYDTMYASFDVTMRTIGKPNDAIYTAPDGKPSGKGTIDSPVDIISAVNFVQPGQTIIARGGVYNMKESIDIVPGNNGTASAMKTLAAYPNERPVFDFGNINNYLYVDGNYWHIYGIDVQHSLNNGIRVGGNYNIIELTRVIANGGSGLQISRRSSSQTTISQWPSYNTILNCEAFDNCDASQNNADGFGAKLTLGAGNKFIGCIARNNIDDGWDLYTKLETGPIGVVTLENCIAYGNGKLSTGTEEGKGDKNGFKLGGEGIAVNHIVKNCIAFGNYATGFTSNSNPTLTLLNCVSYNNRTNISLTTYTSNKPKYELHNFVSYPGALTSSKDNVPEANKIASNYLYDGTASKNSEGKVFTASGFASLTPVLPYARTNNGDLIFGSFLKVVDGILPALPDLWSGSSSSDSSSDSGSGSGSSGGSIGGGATAPVSIQQAVDKIATAEKGSVTVVAMTPEQPAVATTLFEDIKGRDATVAFNFGSFIWEFNGKDIKNIPDNRVFYNLGVQEIKQSNISSLAGSSEVIQIELAHSGEFPCEMKLTFNIGGSYKGKTVYLNYFNEKTGALEPTSTGVVDEYGNVTFVLAHASKYVVTTEKVAGAAVKNEQPAKQAGAAAAGKANINTGSPLKPLQKDAIVEDAVPYVKQVTPSSDTGSTISRMVEKSAQGETRGNLNAAVVIALGAIMACAAGGYLFIRLRKQ